MASNPPSPLPAGSATIFAAPFNLGQHLEHLFEFWYQLAANETPEWRRVVLTCEDIVSQDTADDAKISFDVVNFTGGAIDTSWTTGDYQAVQNFLSQLAALWTPHMDTHHRWSKMDFYRMTFKPEWVGSSPTTKMTPFNLSGPPEYSAVFGGTGGGSTGPMPPQCAFSVTELVPIRRSWGRFYLPFPDAGTVEPTSNRWKASIVSSLVPAIANIYNAMGAAELFPVIPITYSQKERVGALETVISIKADDVPDVIRRRRYKHSSAVTVGPTVLAA